MVAKKKLPDALNNLPIRRDDEVALRMIQGRPLSRSETNVHVATNTGLLAVPLANIVKATPVPGTKGVVRLLVSDPESARPLLRVGPGGVARIRGDKIGSGIPGIGVSTCDIYDTSTTTGDEGEDACDDEESDCHADDLE